MKYKQYTPQTSYAADALRLLGGLIKEARIKRGLTTKDFSSKVGVSRSLLARIEEGHPGCTIGTVFEISAYLGIPLFEEDHRFLKYRRATLEDKATLLQKRVRMSRDKEFDDVNA